MTAGRSVPDFVVAGAGRAGTTGLVEGLRAHPEVFVTTPKEPHYLALHGSRPDFRGPGDQESINRAAVTAEDAYRALFPDGAPYRALGEGSVSTLYYHRRALPELLRLNPEARVVVLLREPVSRAWSSFRYLQAQGREPEQELTAALADEERRRADNWHHLWHYQAMSRYADAIESLQRLVPAERVGIWFHDDLERDYAGTLAEVCHFLGLSDVAGLGEEARRVNISGTPRLRRVHGALVWASGNPVLRRTARTVTTWRMREALRGRMIRRDEVPDRVRREVAPLFADDLVRLRDLLGDRPGLPGWLDEPRSVRR